jgi:hypothetical protein
VPHYQQQQQHVIMKAASSLAHATVTESQLCDCKPLFSSRAKIAEACVPWLKQSRNRQVLCTIPELHALHSTGDDLITTSLLDLFELRMTAASNITPAAHNDIPLVNTGPIWRRTSALKSCMTVTLAQYR